jgi:hypothetical protein
VQVGAVRKMDIGVDRLPEIVLSLVKVAVAVIRI